MLDCRVRLRAQPDGETPIAATSAQSVTQGREASTSPIRTEPLASLLLLSGAMTSDIEMTSAIGKRTPPEPHRAESAGILRWVFLRGPKAVTCEVRVNGRRSYDVCVVPHWDVSSAVVERYDRPASALRRHAEIAWHFRQAGWLHARRATEPWRGLPARQSAHSTGFEG
jgi:hypothetical protein